MLGLAAPVMVPSTDVQHVDPKDGDVQAVELRSNGKFKRADPLAGFSDGTRLGIFGVSSLITGWTTATSIRNMVKDCKSFSEDPGFDIGNNCLSAVITNAIAVSATLVTAYQAWQLRGTVTKSVQIFFTDPYNGPEKRSLEDSMSTHIGAEVRHIGNWDASKHWSSMKREEMKETPVFATTIRGKDIHFAVVDDENNQTTFRVGHGPGPGTEANRKLRARDEDGTFYNDVYFDGGGMDYKAEIGLETNDQSMFIANEDDANWLLRQVECWVSSWLQLSEPGLFIDISDFMSDVTDYKALNYAIYNDDQSAWLTSGVMAPFEGDSTSIIDQVEISHGLDMNIDCLAASTKQKK
ncbi:hypothetical protein G7Z17_g2903 [Cylindrodendrum hubeiense]|uniref:Uncharacterized protein n=1 Tax=Cylindrodendrum hubeiense TaxID=595255 RepID=A0A9P5HBU9_9HYPO|nr:hypothetical protein G7Z17_g2903 [Cylindrodendrum hubeiense]